VSDLDADVGSEEPSLPFEPREDLVVHPFLSLSAPVERGEEVAGVLTVGVSQGVVDVVIAEKRSIPEVPEGDLHALAKGHGDEAVEAPPLGIRK